MTYFGELKWGVGFVQKKAQLFKKQKFSTTSFLIQENNQHKTVLSAFGVLICKKLYFLVFKLAFDMQRCIVISIVSTLQPL